MIDLINRELARQGRTKYWLAQQIGVQRSSVYRALRGDDCKVSLAKKMADALGLKLRRGKRRK